MTMKQLPVRMGRILISAAAAGAIVSTAFTGGVSFAATAAPALPCHASVKPANPPQYTTVRVAVRTAAKAGVTTVAHYRTTNHKKTGQAGRRGRLTVPYYISGATAGYTVVVSVTVKKGKRTGSCSTSFTPQGA